MQAGEGVFLEDLWPKLRNRRWRQRLHEITHSRCLYCGDPSQSIDHVLPLSRGGHSVTENCVPACLGCNGRKGDSDVFTWYRSEPSYDPRRAMALKAWMAGDLRLALHLLEWSAETQPGSPAQQAEPECARTRQPVRQRRLHQTRQASKPTWRWQIAS